MAPEVLIVGDATRRAELQERVARLGYAAAVCTRAALEQRVGRGQLPGAVVVCTEDVDAPALMTALRGTRRGAGVPVTLYGPLTGAAGDLADVLDLGADRFLEAPAADEALATALEELLGPGGPVVAPVGAREATASGSHDRVGDTDTVLGQLHRTLDMLEARLREREGEDADDLDLDALGLPPVEDEREARGGTFGGAGSPAERSASAARASSLELPLPRSEAARSLDAVPAAGGRREPTERLGQAEGRRREPSGSIPATDGSDRSSSVAAPSEDRPRRHAPLPIEDRGTLDRVEVPRLLWTLHRARYTGALSLEHGRIDKRLSWRDGDVAFVRSNVGHDRLVDGLLRRGLLTRDQYEAARQLAAKDPRRTGELLVEAGFVKAAELPRALRNHLMRIIDSTFPWTEGRWTLVPGQAHDEAALVDTPVPLLIAEGVRHRMETTQLTALLGGLEQYPRFRGEAAVLGGARELAERLLLSPSEEAWLPRLDGGATLRELLAQSGTDELELLGLVYVLHVLEHLELSGHGVAAAAHVDPAALDVARIRDRLQLLREGDYFAGLGLPRDAERLEVRRAHAELRSTFASEQLEASVQRELRTELEELSDLLDEARDVLADDALRSAYLAHLEEP